MSFSKWTHPTNEFVYDEFNIYHKDCLTYSDATDRPRELCDDFSLWNDLTQIVNFPTRIPNCDLHSVLFCIYLFLLNLVFALLWLSLHSKILILLWSQFPLALLQPQMEMSLFITQLYYSRTDWDCLCIQLKDIPWKDIFNFGICAAPTEFCLCIQVGTDV